MTGLSGVLGEKGVGGGNAATYHFSNNLLSVIPDATVRTGPNEVRNLGHIILTLRIFVGQ